MKSKTNVVFLMEKEEPIGVFAFFPQHNYGGTYKGLPLKNCYAHIGQHSGCAQQYAKDCNPAEEKDYLELKAELEQIGYELNVITKKEAGL